jgi:hypothetical protein
MLKIKIKLKGKWYWLGPKKNNYKSKCIEEDYPFYKTKEHIFGERSSELMNGALINKTYNNPANLIYWKNLEAIEYYFEDIIYKIYENPHLKKLGVKEFYLKEKEYI